MPRLKSAPSRVQSLPQRLESIQGGSWRSGKSSTERGYDYRWQQSRALYLTKHPLCVMCKERGLVVVATVVDHKVPHQGDMWLFWDENNWQSLCKPDHDTVKAQQEREAGLR